MTLISVGTGKIMRLVVDSCTTSPLMSVRSESAPGSGTSSGVTSAGPRGVEASHALPWTHWWVLYW
jgi:hypothetical protein